MSERSARRANERQNEKQQRRARARAARAAAVGGLLTGAALIAAPGAQAATLQVNAGGDAGNGDCADGACTLREAVAAAVAAPGPDTITFASTVTGEITLTQGALAVDGGGPLTITGPGAASLAISGDADNDDVRDVATSTEDPGDSRIFDLVVPYDDPAGDVSISGLTLREGVASSFYSYTYDGETHGYAERESGGAILAENTKLTITDSVIEDNLATRDGGGISAEQLDLTGTELTGNLALDDGGGAAVDGYSYYGSTSGSHISDSTFTGNTAGGLNSIGGFEPSSSPSGGGLLFDPADGSNVIDSELTGNSAYGTYSYYDDTYTLGIGGGIAAGGYGSFNLHDLAISGNTAGRAGGGASIGGGISWNLDVAGNESAGGAGGVLADGGVISDSTIHGNEANSAGGVELSGTARLESSTVNGNTAVWGGGAAMFGGKLINSTVSGNTATFSDGLSGVAGAGGGVLAFGGGYYYGDVVIRSSTISGNSAKVKGGGLYLYAYESPSDPADAPTVIQSTIVADNAAPAGADVSGGVDSGTTVKNLARVSFSLFESPDSTVFAGDPAASNKIGVDPKLGPLGNHGGTTATQVPADSSPAVDAGVSGGLQTDQRHHERTTDTPIANAPLTDGTDIGAVEVTPYVDRTPPETTITGHPTSGSQDDGPWSFSFKSSEAGSTFECRLATTAVFTRCASPLTYTTLPSGRHTFFVRAVDGAGNKDGTPASFSFEISPGLDRTPPETTLRQVPNEIVTLGKRKKKAKVTFGFAAADDRDSSPYLTYECSLDNGPWVACKSGFTAKVRKGSHTFAVRATDRKGNTETTPATYSFEVKKKTKSKG